MTAGRSGPGTAGGKPVDDEIQLQLIADGDGLTVVGDAADVEWFLREEGLPSSDPGTRWFTHALGVGSVLAEIGAEHAARSARWVKLTPESAGLLKKHGLRRNAKTGLSTGVLKGPKGQVRGFLEFTPSPRSLLSNPAALANAGKLMAQLAMQQSMKEITDYLAVIDKKVDGILRAQKDGELARMIGVGYSLDEAMKIREIKGRVDEITWSKVAGAPDVVHATTACALSRLDALAERLESPAKVGELATAVREAAPEVREWLAVLARCFQLRDAHAVLELDRVLETAPEDLDAHRLALKAARQTRLEDITRCAERLLLRMEKAAGAANAKVLLHPAGSPAVVESSNRVTDSVLEFCGRLGIELGSQSAEARRWGKAATELRDELKGKALETGTKSAAVVVTLGSGISTKKDKLSSGIAERVRRMREGKGPGKEPDANS
nr:hypothetical protein [Streptomyces sp. SID4926]